MQTDEEIPQDNGSILWKDQQGHWCSRLFPLFILIACVCVLLAIPLKIVGSGYMPADDALRHAGFAMTHKSWDQVLVSNAPIPDVHVGWHTFLQSAKDVLQLDGDGLVVFSVVAVFLLVVMPPLFLNRRPESWILSLLLAYSFVGPGPRVLYGRPFIAHMAVLIWLLFLRDRINGKKIPWMLLVSLTLGMAISIWWRTTWFLYLLPIAAFSLARQWRAFFRTGIMLCVATGVATLLSGNPRLPWESLKLAMQVMGSADHASQLVGELQPVTSFGLVILAIVALAFIVRQREGSLRVLFDSAVFYLLVIGWCLGCSSQRWWIDFGVPAFIVLLCEEIDKLLSGTRSTWVPFPWFSMARCGLVLAACAMLFLSYTSDGDARWSNSLRTEYIDVLDENLQEGLPAKGGIVYSDSMLIFYQTFFKYPDAEWRYVLGYEPAFMPEDDLETLRNIQWNRGAWKSFAPWVEKMKPEDRIWVVQSVGAAKPEIPELEWMRLTSSIWSGRLKALRGSFEKGPAL